MSNLPDISDLADDFPGFRMEPNHMRAFEMHVQGMSGSDIAGALNVSIQLISSWKRKPWWRELNQRVVIQQQESFMTRLMNASDRVLGNYFEILEGVDKTDRTASARIQAVKLFMEAGENPLIRKNNMTIQNNTQINHVKLDPDKLKGLSTEELLDAARTGNIPEKAKK